MKKLLSLVAGLAALTSLAVAAEQVGTNRVINEFPAGSVTVEEGLASWQTFYEVASHPRCANCHVGADNRPMWSGPSYGRTRPHGMNINAGVSRIGAETIPCATCHTTAESVGKNVNATPHAPPRVAMGWQLAPVEAEWFGKSSAYICAQAQGPGAEWRPHDSRGRRTSRSRPDPALGLDAWRWA